MSALAPSIIHSFMKECSRIFVPSDCRQISWPEDVSFSRTFEQLLASGCLDVYARRAGHFLAGYVTLPKKCSRKEVADYLLSLGVQGLRRGNPIEFFAWCKVILATDIPVICLSEQCSDVHTVFNKMRGGDTFDTAHFGPEDVIPQQLNVFVTVRLEDYKLPMMR